MAHRVLTIFVFVIATTESATVPTRAVQNRSGQIAPETYVSVFQRLFPPLNGNDFRPGPVTARALLFRGHNTPPYRITIVSNGGRLDVLVSRLRLRERTFELELEPIVNRGQIPANDVERLARQLEVDRTRIVEPSAVRALLPEFESMRVPVWFDPGVLYLDADSVEISCSSGGEVRFDLPMGMKHPLAEWALKIRAAVIKLRICYSATCRLR